MMKTGKVPGKKQCMDAIRAITVLKKKEIFQVINININGKNIVL